MNCEEVSLLIEDLFDGEAEPLLKSRVENHIAVCPACRAVFDKLLALDGLLEKNSIVPPPSAMLDRKLMEAFERQNSKTSTSPAAWWKRIFAGSLTVPKPAFAAALVLFVIALAAANIVGRYSVAPAASDFSAASSESQPPVVVMPSPEIIEKTEIVEVPVVRERVVTRIVYVEREINKPAESQKPLPAQNGTEAVDNRNRLVKKENPSNLAMNGAVEDGGYVTRANLLGFQPPTELKARIIRQDKTDEK